MRSRFPAVLLALMALFPRLGEWIVERVGSHDYFRRVHGKLSAKAE